MRSPDRSLNTGPTEYDEGVLIIYHDVSCQKTHAQNNEATGQQDWNDWNEHVTYENG
jgi:hypothetical protein